MKFPLFRFGSVKSALACSAALSLGATTQPVCAQVANEEEPAYELSANIGLVSDYRFRGISLSDRDPAIQGGVDLETRAGWFAGTWVSTIADYEGANVEFDLYAGYAGSVAGLDFSTGAYAYIYPGGEGVNYVELTTTVGRSIGKANIEAEFAYVPDQKNTDSDNVYLGATLTAPIGNSPLQMKLRGGLEDGFYEEKWDWEAGLAYEHDLGSATLSAVGSNHGTPAEAGRLGKTGIMTGLTLFF